MNESQEEMVEVGEVKERADRLEKEVVSIKNTLSNGGEGKVTISINIANKE